MNNQYEILAPAGSYETFKAVINAGADAVYLAGNMFGARAYASNLTEEELLLAIDYAHLHNRKIYLTVNTLLKNNELKYDLYNYIKPFYEAGLDAVIVQDYGVMKYIHEIFPDMEIHASTQMTITDPEYTTLLKDYGVTRVVPARELSLDEIKRLYQESGCEIECFVHGALCYCYSGQCLMSSFIGGRSGNRGRCAQPCRLAYEKDGSQKAILSLKDLCTLDILPDILEAGVYSLKIEGRMKSPEYAAGVTSIYRKYVDMYLKNGRKGYTVSSKDRDRLLMLFDRGGLTDGYYKRHNGKEMIAEEFKSDKSQQDKKTFEEKISSLYVGKDIKYSINGIVTLFKDSPAMLSLSDDKDNYVTVSGEMVQKALKNPMTESDITKQINKLGGTFFEFGELNIMAEEDIFISNKALNELRRQAVSEFTKQMMSSYRRVAQPPYEQEDKANQENEYQGISVHVMNKIQAKVALEYRVSRLILDTELMADEDILECIRLCNARKVKCYIGLPRIANKFKTFINNNIKNWIEEGIDGFLIRSIAWITYLKRIGFEGEIIADYNCYAYNDLATSFMEDAGVSGMICPVELNEKELKKLSLPNSELIVYGKIPLMITANCIDKSTNGCHSPNSAFRKLTDRKNAELSVLTCCRYCYNLIYNSVPIYLSDKNITGKDYGISFVGVVFADEDENNTRKIIENVIAETPADFEFTRGHFTRGVE